MNIEYFREGLDFIAATGVKLTPEQALLIENTLIVMQNENKFRNIFFWGRINAIENDYYIAYGYSLDCLKERKFFYSTNCFQWISLPPAQEKYYEACIYCRDMFIGDPTIVTSIIMDPKFEIDEKQIITATEPEIYKIKEEDRLAAIVEMITEESALIPRGGLFKMVDMNIIYNPEFRGLNDLQGNDLINYQLYRCPKNKYNYNLLKRNDYNYAIDFLDTLDDIIPENQGFSLTLERNDSLVIIRSLIWSGMSFFHKIFSRKHGFVYFGNGKKNLDILFMIPELCPRIYTACQMVDTCGCEKMC